MKKILAGVLAAASLTAMTVSASATTTDKIVTKAGEVTYDVAVTAPKVVLDLVMPSKIAASLNPYGAEIKLDATTTSTKGIASIAYEVTNKSEDYGVYLDATAITTVTTTDTTKWAVTGTNTTAGTKSACAGLIAVENVTADPMPIASKSATASGQGALLFDSTVAADRTTNTVAGQTKWSKVAFIKASNGGTDGKVYLIIAGDLAKSSGTDEVVWNEDDAINVNLVLKVVAGPKTL